MRWWRGFSKAAPAGIEGNLESRRRQSDYSYEISARRTR
jgi:hypothetical protein